jgi:predicted MFS family arabinose efflux permease
MIVGVKRPSRGLATGFYQLATNLIGGLGALLTGALSDHLGGAIAIAMACTATLNIVSAFGLFLSCHYLAKRQREGEFD